MRVAVPVDEGSIMYRFNPCSAPSFTIYEITQHKDKTLSMQHTATLANPSVKEAQNFICDCSLETENQLEHKLWHYTIVETLRGCDYVLAQDFCKNTEHTLDVAGIKLFMIPGFIKQAELAVKNFIIGAHFAHNVQHIHLIS